MSSRYKDALVSLKGDLKSYVSVKIGLSDLLETPAGGFMSRTEASNVKTLPNDSDQMDRIIEILQGKRDKDFQTFCKILRKANHEHWAIELERKAEEDSMGRGEGMCRRRKQFGSFNCLCMAPERHFVTGPYIYIYACLVSQSQPHSPERHALQGI